MSTPKKPNRGQASPYDAPNPQAPKPVETVELSQRELIVKALKTSVTRSMRWHELVAACGKKAVGDMVIQLDRLGTRDANIKVWYGVSKEFHDAVQDLRDEMVIRLFQVSPLGYFPQGAEAPPLPLTKEYKVAHNSPHLLITAIELVSG